MRKDREDVLEIEYEDNGRKVKAEIDVRGMAPKEMMREIEKITGRDDDE